VRNRGPSEPSGWVRRWIAGVRPGGRVLDVACGAGRHLRLASELGLLAHGIDRDLSGVQDLASTDGITLIKADLEQGGAWPLGVAEFDGVIVTNYLHRPIMPDIVRSVGRTGLLIYETFERGHAALGGRPSKPAHLLEPNELIGYVAPHLVVVAYESGRVITGGQRIVQRIAAMGAAHPWVTSPPILD
jgi:SAM-dependent methyltransferase